jgi:hypothetical protein
VLTDAHTTAGIEVVFISGLGGEGDEGLIFIA